MKKMFNPSNNRIWEVETLAPKLFSLVGKGRFTIAADAPIDPLSLERLEELPEVELETAPALATR